MRICYKLRLFIFVLVSIFIVDLGVFRVSVGGDSVKIKKPDISNKLLFLRNEDIWAYNPENKSEKRLTYAGNIRNYAVSADATRMAYIRLKNLYVYNTESGVEEFIAAVSTDVSQPSFSPLGDKIALISHTKEEVEVRISYFSKPVKERVRHIFIADLKTKNFEDVTPDIPYGHSAVSWSPDGRWLSFASFRFGFIDLIDPSSHKGWSVYLMDLNSSKHKTSKICDGMISVWRTSDQVVVSDDGVGTSVLSIYDIKTKTLKPSTLIRAGFSPAKFTLGGINNEIIYYETADGSDNGLIRSHNAKTDKTDDVVMNARVPLYVK